jgi:nicotinamide mononucleotide transporter
MIILGYDISYLELFGSIISLSAVILAARDKVWNWPVSIVGQILFFFLFLDNKLYGNMTLQIFFTFVAIYGWYYWGKEEHKKIKTLGIKKTILFGLILSLLTIFIAYILNILKIEYPLLDAATTVLSIGAVFLLSQKYLESWIIWIIVDILSVALFYLKGIDLVSIEYVFITGIATYGFINWIKLYGKQMV